jgi:hypothetical protein
MRRRQGDALVRCLEIWHRSKVGQPCCPNRLEAGMRDGDLVASDTPKRDQTEARGTRALRVRAG